MSWPAYLDLHASGELVRRAAEAVEALRSCTICPRNCRVDRLENRAKVCATGRRARVSSYFPHFGEEDCLRGFNGSGTIFFSFCNLKCVFCQNHDTSQAGEGDEVDAERLAAMMLELQAAGCHNINFVTPEHVVPQLLEALPIAVERGLRLPLVYNTSSYDSMESLRWLDGVVDLYMPDFKVWTKESAIRYLKAKDYPEVARRIVAEMHRQVGPLVVDDNGLARRGVLVRHLVMPGLVDESEQIFRFLREEISPDTYVNVMGQYHPDHRAMDYPEIARPPTDDELRDARRRFRAAGLSRIDTRDRRRLVVYLSD
ncbi:MAG: radical SAM protein [Deltaproteobacteria bacterium]|nr:radical SAM protein [Deltaproteobacteria bacterium]